MFDYHDLPPFLPLYMGWPLSHEIGPSFSCTFKKIGEPWVKANSRAPPLDQTIRVVHVHVSEQGVLPKVGLPGVSLPPSLISNPLQHHVLCDTLCITLHSQGCWFSLFFFPVFSLSLSPPLSPSLPLLCGTVPF